MNTSTRTSSRKGQALIEYAFIVLLAGIASLLVVTTLGGQVARMFSNVVAGF